MRGENTLLESGGQFKVPSSKFKRRREGKLYAVCIRERMADYRDKSVICQLSSTMGHGRENGRWVG
jgi:hypothetical protein